MAKGKGSAFRDPENTASRAIALADGRETRRAGVDVLEAVENARAIPAAATPETFRARARAEYLYSIETHGGLAKAAADAGCSNAVARAFAGRFPEFAAAVRDALARNRDSLAAEAQRRARGVAVERFNRDGEPAGVAIEYADGLLVKALDRADRIIGDLPAERNSSIGALDATLVQKLSPEGRRALRIVLAELAGLVATEADMQLERIPTIIEAKVEGTC